MVMLGSGWFGAGELWVQDGLLLLLWHCVWVTAFIRKIMGKQLKEMSDADAHTCEDSLSQRL